MHRFPSVGTLLIAALVLNGCADTSAGPLTQPVEFSVLHEGVSTYTGTTTDKGSKVLSTQAGYEAELMKYSHELPHDIDFSTSRVLLVDMGRRKTGGFVILVSDVYAGEDHVVARVLLLRPGTNCGVTFAVTNPYQFVRIATESEVLVVEELKTYQCGSQR